MTENDLASENGITQTWAERLLNIVLCRGDLANEKLEARPVAVTELFRYGSRLDYIYVIIGSILAALIGVAVPLTCVLTGFICNIYLKENKQIGNDELWKHAMWLCLGFGLVGVLLLVLCYLQYYFLYTASKNVVKNLRKEFVKAVLKQEAIWFDQKHAGTITTQLNENIARIQDGIGDKIGLILSANSIKRLIEISGDAGATTEESIMNVKTVATCNGQKQMVEKYSSKLASGLIWAIRYGIPCYYDGIIHDPGIIFITTSCILIGSYFLGLLGPHMMAILKARVAAAVIYQTIDKETKADSQPFNDEQILQCNGRIEFRDVHFKYPTRYEIYNYNIIYILLFIGNVKVFKTKESPILQGLSWSASPGETVAFVGKSGCGKSTSVGFHFLNLELEEPTVNYQKKKKYIYMYYNL
uniref:ABC transmembrane type-1 domain-containing protein n=1 Tax=Heterorhabditis bacteriophora TaxID=37862 RepID=A0A1I7WDX0_HETBA